MTKSESQKTDKEKSSLAEKVSKIKEQLNSPILKKKTTKLIKIEGKLSSKRIEEVFEKVALESKIKVKRILNIKIDSLENTKIKVTVSALEGEKTYVFYLDFLKDNNAYLFQKYSYSLVK